MKSEWNCFFWIRVKLGFFETCGVTVFYDVLFMNNPVSFLLSFDADYIKICLWVLFRVFPT